MNEKMHAILSDHIFIQKPLGAIMMLTVLHLESLGLCLRTTGALFEDYWSYAPVNEGVNETTKNN